MCYSYTALVAALSVLIYKDHKSKSAVRMMYPKQAFRKDFRLPESPSREQPHFAIIKTVSKPHKIIMEHTLDLTGLKCPLPILRAKKALATLQSGDIVHIQATDAGAPADFAAFCHHTGHELLSSTEDQGIFKLSIRHK